MCQTVHPGVEAPDSVRQIVMQAYKKMQFWMFKIPGLDVTLIPLGVGRIDRDRIMGRTTWRRLPILEPSNYKLLHAWNLLVSYKLKCMNDLSKTEILSFGESSLLESSTDFLLHQRTS